MTSIAYSPSVDKVEVESDHTQEQPPKGEQPTAKEQFPGFEDGNGYTMFDHAMFDEMLSQISNVAELKIVMYVHRHTKGYHQDEVSLSTEEFVLGRERQNGERYDRGTNLCERSVKSGVKRALEHGYITRRQEGNRVYFSLKMAETKEEGRDDQDQAEEGQNLHPSTDATEGQNLHRSSAKAAPITGKTCTGNRQNLHPSTRSAPHSSRSTGRSRSSSPPPKETQKNLSKEREKESGLSLSPNSKISIGQPTAGGYQERHSSQATTTRRDPQLRERPTDVKDANNVSHEERVRMNMEKYAALLARTRRNEAA